MSTPIKTREQVVADPDAFRAAYARAREALGALDGVVSIGFGQKETGGAYRDDIAMVVFVREKKAEDELAPADRVPPHFEGYPTDVVVMAQGAPLTCVNQSTYEVIQGGIQIVPEIKPPRTQYSAGTLGCIVRKRGDTGRENVYLLSCKHVLFFGGAGAGDGVYHPFAPPPAGSDAGSAGDSHLLGPIQREACYENVAYTPPGPPPPPGTPTQFFLDCATARIDIDSKCVNSTCTRDKTRYSPTVVDLALGTDDAATPGLREDNLIADVRSVIVDPSIAGQQVFKVGRTTRRTVGTVRRVNGTLQVLVNPDEDPANPPSGRMEAVGLIEIDFDPASTPSHLNCNNHPRFGEFGDSGAVVVDAQRRVIGLLCAGGRLPAVGAPTSSDLASYASHIFPVLDRLGVCIATTGGSARGACAATDGTGTAPAPPPASGGGGGGGFHAAGLAGPLGARRTIPAPVFVSDVQQARMFALRDQFRESPRGRELHAVFADVRREVGYLVRNARPVTVAWHRSQGPAFFAHVLNHLRGETDSVPLTIAGVTRQAMLERMAEVLAAHGSNPLRAAIARYRDELMPILATAADVHACMALLRAAEEAEDASIPQPAAAAGGREP